MCTETHKTSWGTLLGYDSVTGLIIHNFAPHSGIKICWDFFYLTIN